MAAFNYRRNLPKPSTGHPPPGAKPHPQGTPRVYNRASQKMETRNQMQHYHRPSAAARALGAPKHVSGTGPAHVPPAPFNPLGPNSTPAQIQHWATKTVQGQEHTELEPFRKRRAELGPEEQATVGRYQGYAGAQQGILGGIQGTQEASAKTFGNEAAEATLRHSKEIETTGQNAANANAGYMDPQLKAVLANQQTAVHATGQAREAEVAQNSQTEKAFLENMRAAAATRATEGQQQLQGGFAKQRSELGIKEGQITSGKAGAVSKLYTEALQKQFTNKATEIGLGLKGNALTQKAAETGAKLRSAGSIAAANRASTAATAAAGQRAAGERTAETNRTSRENKQADIHYKETHPTGESHKPVHPSYAEGAKYAQAVSTSLAQVRKILGSQNEGRGNAKSQKKAREFLTEHSQSGDVSSAALNLAVYGRLGPKDREAAAQYGLTPKMRPAWFRKK